jgi:hypothetical protein
VVGWGGRDEDESPVLRQEAALGDLRCAPRGRRGFFILKFKVQSVKLRRRIF